MLDLLREIAGLSAEKLLVSRLVQAIENDDAVAVQQLLDAGASPDAQLDRHGSRPLHHVHSAAVARHLLAAGADARARDENGRTPLDHARRRNYSSDVRKTDAQALELMAALVTAE